MRTIKIVIVLSLLFAVHARAQDCDNTVADQVGVLSAGQLQEVTSNAQGLINQGADVRIRTFGPTSNLDLDEKDTEKACRSWQSPNGGRKSTLVVLMVSPAGHKMGIYYGAAFSQALDNHWNRIKSDYMGPHFKTGDWAGGFIAAEQQLAARISASKDEALHPAMNTTVNQPTDLTGLWTILGWGLALGVVIVGTILFFSWWRRRQKEQQELREARQAAINAKARASDLIGKAEKGPNYNTALDEFSRLSSLVGSDPYAEDLEIADYNTIAHQYERVVDILRNRPDKTTTPNFTSATGTKTKAKHPNATKQPTKTTDQQKVTNTTTVINNEVGGVPYPVFIPEPTTYRERDPEPEPERHRSSSSKSDSDGGGSSSWSDSSSSDSGGSSDFGGGGDSGGGGSSDF